MEHSQEKDYSFLGNDTFPNLYDALVYERKFKSEYLERQIYERLLKSEPSIVKFIENQSEHLSMQFVLLTFPLNEMYGYSRLCDRLRSSANRDLKHR